MRWLPAKVAAAIAVAAIVLGSWVFFAPLKLGGSTSYAVTSGISMEPLLHKNNLAVVRTAASYRVGDVVLYQSSILHRSVLHRIIVIQNGHYYFKGDNNDFVDPGYATRSALLGTLWFKVPAVGGALSWFGEPTHAALLASLATMAVVLTGATTTKSRRRRRRGSKPMHISRRLTETLHLPSREGPVAAGAGPHPTSARRPVPYLEGPTAGLVAVAVTGVLAFVLLIAGFSHPLQRTSIRTGAYHSAGTFSYTANAATPNSVYPSGVVKTGDPIYASLTNTVSLHFGYRFTSPLPHHVTGTVELRALVLSQSDTWKALTTVAPITKFSGDTTSVTRDLALSDMYSFINSVTTESGLAGANYSVDIQPVVHLVGTVSGQSIDERFSPILPFAVSQTAIRIDAPVATAPAGATYVAPTAASALSAVLNPTQAGGIPVLAANDLTIAKYHVSVSTIRALGVILAVLAVALGVLSDRRRRLLPRSSEEQQIAKRFHALIVPVTELGSSHEGHTPIAVPDFTSLAGLARFLERPILYEVNSQGQRTFAVDDDALRYVTAAIDRRRPRDAGDVRSTDTDPDSASAPRDASVPSEAKTEAKAFEKEVTGSAPAHSLSTRSMVARGGAALLLLAVATTLTLSFTASTTVPASNVGQTVEGGSVAQGTPTGCSSLNLTALATGSGTFSNSGSRTLILGSAGVDTINATGQYNCIVAGGGKDKVTGTATDVCIIGPTTGATYSSCTQKAQ